MRLSNLNLIAILLGASSIAAANGDTVQMPSAGTEGLSAQQAVQMNLPLRGMNTQQVEARFGAPQEKLPAVGKPPISRWVYPDYTVYFEHQYVIHTVVRRK